MLATKRVDKQFLHCQHHFQMSQLAAMLALQLLLVHTHSATPGTECKFIPQPQQAAGVIYTLLGKKAEQSAAEKDLLRLCKQLVGALNQHELLNKPMQAICKSS